MEPLEPNISPLPASFPIVPATNPEGGWGAQRTPLAAPPLGLEPAQRDGELDPLVLRTFVLSTLSPQDRRALRERLTPDLLHAAAPRPGSSVHLSSHRSSESRPAGQRVPSPQTQRVWRPWTLPMGAFFLGSA